MATVNMQKCVSKCTYGTKFVCEKFRRKRHVRKVSPHAKGARKKNVRKGIYVSKCTLNIKLVYQKYVKNTYTNIKKRSRRVYQRNKSIYTAPPPSRFGRGRRRRGNIKTINSLGAESKKKPRRVCTFQKLVICNLAHFAFLHHSLHFRDVT